MDGSLVRRRNERFCLARVFIAILLLPWTVGGKEGVCGARSQRDGDIQLQWACVAMNNKGGELHWEKITRGATLEAGAQIKMYFRLEKKAFVYVIHQNAAGELNLLFPLRFYGPDSEPRRGESYYLPGGDAWLALGEGAGEENIFLLVGTERMVRLEELLGDYAVSAKEKKPNLAGEVLREIQALRSKHRDLSASAERPITMAGRVRGMQEPVASSQPDVALLADEITAAGFFSRTIAIQRS